MTEEEYFRKTYPDSCYGDKPLSPYWDFFQDGVEFGERQSETKIEELETRCTELKKENLENESEAREINIRFDELLKKYILQKDQLTKAKEIIKGLLSCCRNYPQENAEKMKQAEQFIREKRK